MFDKLSPKLRGLVEAVAVMLGLPVADALVQQLNAVAGGSAFSLHSLEAAAASGAAAAVVYLIAFLRALPIPPEEPAKKA